MSFSHAFDSTVLREYDIRGIVGKTLHPADAFAIGRCFGTVVARNGGRTIAVGYDGRVSSPSLEPALVAGLMASGMEVLRIGLGPTPMLYFASTIHKTDGAVMVTGSHNPPDYNGFKMMLARKPFFGAQIREIGRMAADGDVVAETTGTEQTIDVSDSYIDRLAQDWDGGDRALNIVWDNGNGAAGDILTRLVARLPGTHTILYPEIDGGFPNHHPDPTVPKNLEALIAEVRTRHADLGIAFDGDADRIGAVDGDGEILFGDQLLVVLARDVLKTHPGATIIADVKASQVLFDEVAKAGGAPLMWKTGHSLIKAKMAETGCPPAKCPAMSSSPTNGTALTTPSTPASASLASWPEWTPRSPPQEPPSPTSSTPPNCASTATITASSRSSRKSPPASAPKAPTSPKPTASASSPTTAGGSSAPPTPKPSSSPAAKPQPRKAWTA